MASESESKSALKKVDDEASKEVDGEASKEVNGEALKVDEALKKVDGEEEKKIPVNEKIISEDEGAIKTSEIESKPASTVAAEPEPDKVEEKPQPEVETDGVKAENDGLKVECDGFKAEENNFDFGSIEMVPFQRNVSSNPPEGPLNDIQIIVSDSEEPIADCVWPPVKTEAEKMIYPSTYRRLKSLYQTDYPNHYACKTADEIKLYRSPLAIDANRSVRVSVAEEPFKYLPSQPVEINGCTIQPGALTCDTQVYQAQAPLPLPPTSKNFYKY